MVKRGIKPTDPNITWTSHNQSKLLATWGTIVDYLLPSSTTMGDTFQIQISWDSTY